ncbi:YciI family protein [Chelativorans sp. M5D2P16]|uniref:YciI family protein n=1 Tax=Chelativorans sp. M5D2P16 TaxID=3095678 RepID=UPI002ACA52AE|nr:YciI family protein [Chelativorans sp. M5D2P16]MDZ5698099.1 YciI family protein [Chelativorans sp. M5D2P16]
MRYVCLVYGDEAELQALSDEDSLKLTRDSLDYDRVLESGGHLVVAHALESPAFTTALRTKGGQVVATDGPYSETKEQLLGFLLIEADDRQEAVALASRVPMVEHGHIELRAIHLLEGE